jgi:anti-anti-sigma factor
MPRGQRAAVDRRVVSGWRRGTARVLPGGSSPERRPSVKLSACSSVFSDEPGCAGGPSTPRRWGRSRCASVSGSAPRPSGRTSAATPSDVLCSWDIGLRCSGSSARPSNGTGHVPGSLAGGAFPSARPGGAELARVLVAQATRPGSIAAAEGIAPTSGSPSGASAASCDFLLTTAGHPRRHPQDFQLERWREGGDVRIKLCGELDAEGVAELEAALSDAHASDAECVVLDLQHLVVMDRTGLQTILTAHERLSGGRALLLRRGPPPGPATVRDHAGRRDAVLPRLSAR